MYKEIKKYYYFKIKSVNNSLNTFPPRITHKKCMSAQRQLYFIIDNISHDFTSFYKIKDKNYISIKENIFFFIKNYNFI